MTKRKRRNQSRKRKALPRTDSGRLSRSTERQTIERAQSDLETRQSLSELREGRARGLGLTREQADCLWPKDVCNKPGVASESIAGRMAVRGILTWIQAAAIDEYARRVRRAGIAMQSPSSFRCSLSSPNGRTEMDDETYGDVMASYNAAFAVVRDVGVRACRAVNIIVRDLCELPASERGCVRAAASALVKHFGFEERARAA